METPKPIYNQETGAIDATEFLAYQQKLWRQRPEPRGECIARLPLTNDLVIKVIKPPKTKVSLQGLNLVPIQN